MKRAGCFLGLLLFCSMGVSGNALAAPSRPETVNHDLKVMVLPSSTFFSAEDTVTLAEPAAPDLTFRLHADLTLSSLTPGVEIIRLDTVQGPVPVTTYFLKTSGKFRTFTIAYQGQIAHPVQPIGKEQARGFGSTPGTISPEGVYLSGSSFWYPVFDNRMVSFRMNVTLPEGWSAVSQGSRKPPEKDAAHARVTWDSPEPQDEIFLVAGRFHEYTREGTVSAMAFLRTPDEVLAAKYLDATASYLALYENLIGPYPYQKFALVENFWETGFGMPSFTLLGPKVIRLPFIINSSYPHEILHNWWGNSVYPDYENGNWAEGLTAYLADHLIKEQEGGAAEYRYSTLQKYADYVFANRDFPLTRFTSRHSSAEEAVGYGKAQMFFHMLRLQLGDRAFVSSLRHFYREHRFGFASYRDLRESFEKTTGLDLSAEFRQWTEEPGAPELRLASAQASPEQEGFTLALLLEQAQQSAAYRLRVPVAITLEGSETAYQTSVEMDAKKLLYRIHLPARPLRVDLDPEFDLFRRLDRQELPPAITQALGARRMLVILPGKAEPGLYDAYLDLAKALGSSGPESISIYVDREISAIPSDRAVVVLGSENLFFNRAVQSLKDLPFEQNEQGFLIDTVSVPAREHAVVFAGRNPGNQEMALLAVAADNAGILAGIARKLPHYHKYSYLAFKGPDAENVLKGRWQVVRSPLFAWLPGPDARTSDADRARLAARSALSRAANAVSPARMSETLKALTSPEMEGRGLGTDGLDRAARFLADQFREAGLKSQGPGEGTYLQEWSETISGRDRAVNMKNVVGLIPGSDPVLSKECIVLGAHYDHLGAGWPEARAQQKGMTHPGADDNASGVSLLLELGRELNGQQDRTGRSLVFVAFTAEEAEKRGSRHFVENLAQFCPDGVFAMLNLDTIGRLTSRRLYVISANSSKGWEPLLKEAAAAAGLTIDLVREDLDSSDQTSFLDAGIPAVQLFTGPHGDYHRPTDTTEKLNLYGMTKIGAFVKTVIGNLVRRTDPLAYAAPETPVPVQEEPKKERKSGLGIIPDFSFQGKGCRLGGVLPDSPAAGAGMREGDVITGINSLEITGLKDLSAALKSVDPGERVAIRFIRDNKEMTAETEVRQR